MRAVAQAGLHVSARDSATGYDVERPHAMAMVAVRRLVYAVGLYGGYMRRLRGACALADSFLYERVYDYVLDEIRSQSLRPGDRVPSEKELAERFGVSRITSKRALAMLAEAGLVDRRRGKGSFVVEDAPRLRALRAHGRTRPSRTPSLQSSSCLALVLPDASDAYGLALLCAIEERCAEYGYHLVVRRTRDSQPVEEQAIEALAGGVADGLIVFPVHGEFYNASLVRLVLDRSPLVLVDRYLPGIPACSVHTDNVAAAQALTGHLLDQGHRQIAFFSPPADKTSSIEERIRGFESALRERGLAPATGRYVTDLHSTLPGSATDRGAALVDRDRIRAFVAREPAVTGFVACEYSIAVMLREVLEELGELGEVGDAAGRRVIACFDSPEADAKEFVHIQQDQRTMGRLAVDLLISQLSGENIPSLTTVPFSLVDPAGR